MPRTTQKSQPEINLALLKTLSKSQDLGLKLEFELTHLDYIADKVSDFWGLDTEITGQDLLETIYYDFAELNIENAFAKQTIDIANSVATLEDKESFIERRKEETNWGKENPDRYCTSFFIGFWGLAGSALMGFLTTPLLGIGAAIVVIGLAVGIAKLEDAYEKEDKAEKLDKISEQFESFTTKTNEKINTQLDELLTGEQTGIQGLQINQSTNRPEFGRLPTLRS
ncbi:MAG: hypothetical protein CMP22_00450 [Rickettsiales bacterium]|nr:hypothetical protein [Rickettsiales bacterium]|tara:strand:+ start:382 stop:1059 length:678 start_codon:yes stop_codon:yes gene_type:complete